MKKNFRWILTIFICLTFMTALITLSVGRYDLGLRDNLTYILGRLHLQSIDLSQAKYNVLTTIRFPRMIACILIGGGLALSGAIYQAIFKNPLVSPDLLGVSQGASVGAALSIIWGAHFTTTQILAFSFGLLAVFISTMIPKILRNDSTLMLVLSGVIVSGFMSSVIGLLKYLADPETQLPAITYWQLGSLSSVRNHSVTQVIIPIIISMIILLAIRWRINVMSLGDQEAQLVGMNVALFRTVAVICSTIITASSVCIAGTIGWIGLIIPHLSRLIIGPDNRKVLPLSVTVGATFMLVVDTIARSLSQSEIPISVVTGFIGAPLYFWLLTKQQVKFR